MNISSLTGENGADERRPKTVAIIPARGGSQGIPRKNARLLNGRPLITYVIQAAQFAERLDWVVISTDDPELKAIAQTMGIHVLDRPEHLAGPEITLDEVTVHVAEQIRQMGIKPERIVTLQPTCPLISSSSIDRAVEKMIEDPTLDTVVSVVRETHLEWILNHEGRPVPNYKARVNRQHLSPKFRETGAIVACKGEMITSGTRFGANTGMLELPRLEAIDIDDYFDWWLAEKSLRRKRICFHVLGNAVLGLGHAYRALTLADRLIDHELSFVVNEESQLAADLIRSRYYPVMIAPKGGELEAIRQAQPDLVINDVLNTEIDFVRSLKAFTSVINFEDLGPGTTEADAVINAMYNPAQLNTIAEVYSGIEYCCLRDEFYSITPRSTSDDVRQILLLFGGTDASGGTLKVLQWLDALEGDWGITVVVGMGYRDIAQLKEKSAACIHSVNIVNDTRVISRHMHQADIAITSAGRTVFELASLGVPMMVYAQNARETTHPFAVESHGTIYMGDIDNADRETFQETANELLTSRLLRGRMSQSLLKENPRGGIHQVLGIVQKHLEHPDIHILKTDETSINRDILHPTQKSLPDFGSWSQPRRIAHKGV